MNKNKMLSASEAAKLLGISTTSVRNWIRHGYLHRNELGFSRDEVESLLVKIRSGEIDRLNRRANKRETAGTITPDAGYTEICSRFSSLKLEPDAIIWLAAAALFRLHGLAENKPLTQLSAIHPEDYRSQASAELLKKRLTELSLDTGSSEFQNAAKKIESVILPDHAPADTDVCGIIYQSVCRRGSRSASGSFYTPSALTDELVSSALRKLPAGSADKVDPSFIDPCCGSGQFILSFIKAGGSAERAVGIDSDATAAFIAAVNILLQCPELRTAPMIFTADSLLSGLPGAAEKIAPFDIAATNPPWGAATTRVRKKLSQRFPPIKSGESFSYFISRCLELVKPGGTVSLVLPESITNVRRHDDVRRHIVSRGRVTDITERGRLFKNVYTPVISMEINKYAAEEPSEGSAAYTADCFYININTADTKIIDSIYKQPHITLEGRAEWALGIVTGNNERFISGCMDEGFEPIIRGSDILPGRIASPSGFIDYRPELFQQTAPEWKYRAAEKLVYRFISKRLTFAVDTEGHLTLNSANNLIPGAELIEAGWSAERLAAFLNSDIPSFVFRKKFNSVKVLRSHLEALPLPLNGEYRLTGRQIEHIQNSL